jgi:hypothetical protein
LGQGDAPGRDAEQDAIARPVGLLENLMCHPVDDSGQIHPVDDHFAVWVHTVKINLWSCHSVTSFPASRDGP